MPDEAAIAEPAANPPTPGQSEMSVRELVRKYWQLQGDGGDYIAELERRCRLADARSVPAEIVAIAEEFRLSTRPFTDEFGDRYLGSFDIAPGPNGGLTKVAKLARYVLSLSRPGPEGGSP